MKGTPNVIRRAGVIYFRRGVPKHVQGRLDKRELVVSLATSDIRIGRLRSRFLYVASEKLFFQLEAAVLSKATVERIIREFCALVGQIGELNLLTTPPLDLTEHDSLREFLGDHLVRTKEELGRGDFTMATLAATIAI